MEITTENQKWPKIGANRIKAVFLARRAKKLSAKDEKADCCPNGKKSQGPRNLGMCNSCE